MSYKTEFANNNTDLQSILNSVNNLGDGSLISGSAVNLDEELATQDELISQIFVALKNKGAGSFDMVDIQPTSVAKTLTLDAAKDKNNLVMMFRGGEDTSDSFAQIIQSQSVQGEDASHIVGTIIIDGVCVAAPKTYYSAAGAKHLCKDARNEVTWDSATGTLTTTTAGKGFVSGNGIGSAERTHIIYFAW